jgi:hypothetical protein
VAASDIEAHKKFWAETLGGTAMKFGGNNADIVKFPNVLIFFRNQKPTGGTIGTTANHIGFSVPNLRAVVALALGPDDVKVELLENKQQTVPVILHHMHFFGQQNAEMRAWYVKVFGAKPREAPNFLVADLPGVALNFTASMTPVVGTTGRAVDHIGFEVKNLEAFVKKLEEMGIKPTVPYRSVPALGLSIAFIQDPWGTSIELTEGLDKVS